MTRNDSVAGKSPGAPAVTSPTRSPPARPAIQPPIPKAVSFTEVGEIPREAAACSLSRTAIIDRPSRLRWSSATPISTRLSAMRQMV